MRFALLCPLAFALTALLSLPAFGLSNEQGLDPGNFDIEISACENFYGHANGAWLRNNPVPADRSRWGLFDELAERSRRVQHEILTEAAAADAEAGTVRQQLGDFFATGMDEPAIERAGHAPIQATLDAIAAIERSDDIVAFLHEQAAQGSYLLYGIAVLPDMQQSDRQMAYVAGSGLGLPDRDYYTRDDDDAQAKQVAYRTHIANLLQLLGGDADSTVAQADQVYAIEDRLARVTMTRLQSRDPGNFYRPIPPSAAQALSPTLAWDAFFEQLNLVGQTQVSYATPGFFNELDFMLREVPVDHWQAYLRFHVANTAAPYLSQAFANQYFDFHQRTLRGQSEQQPRWQRVLDTISGSMGEAVGQLYVEKTFPPEAKVKALVLVEHLQAALKQRLQTLDWMGEETRAEALAKFASFTAKIGYPDRWIDYSDLRIDRSHYYDNVRAARAFENRRQLAKVGQPVDPGEWEMPPQQVNAYYHPLRNEIAFPAAILQPPFFDPQADDALNFGAIGGVIGHELLHGYDDQGSKFDADGNYRMWWTAEDRSRFEARAQKLVEQANEFVALRNFQNGQDEVLTVNGALTLGENIADLGGLIIAHAALRNVIGDDEPAPIDGLSADQRFFHAWAQVWRRNYRDQELRLRLTTDVHAPAKFRSNGPLSNLDAFQNAFDCEADDAMVRPEASRVRIW